MTIRDLQAVVYTTAKGKSYTTAMDSGVFAQTGTSTARKVGGADYTGTPALEPLPRGFRPRGVYVSAAGNKRFVVCLDANSDLFQGVETQINLPVLGGASVAYTVYRTRDELDRRRYRDPNG